MDKIRYNEIKNIEINKDCSSISIGSIIKKYHKKSWILQEVENSNFEVTVEDTITKVVMNFPILIKMIFVRNGDIKNFVFAGQNEIKNIIDFVENDLTVYVGEEKFVFKELGEEGKKIFLNRSIPYLAIQCINKANSKDLLAEEVLDLISKFS